MALLLFTNGSPALSLGRAKLAKGVMDWPTVASI